MLQSEPYRLRPCQLEAVADILDKKKILIADDPGFGKCAEAICAKIAIENRLGYDINTLITCPPSVAEHWEDEARKWYKKRDQTKSTIIQTQNYGESLEQARNSDFVIVGYSTLSDLGDSQSAIDALSGIKFQHGIPDEIHNAKNPESIRSMAVKKLFDSMEYLTLLSGTPVPNSVLDIYMLLSLLDKDTFPIDSTNPRALLSSFYNTFREDPEFVSRLLNDRMLRRTTDEYLHTNFPELRQRDLDINLEGEHREVYQSVYENDNITPGTKLWQLIKASIDPNLVNPEFLDGKLRQRIGRMESNIYGSLDNLVEEVVDSNGKVLLFSDLKEGVTEKLRERYEKYGAFVIDGDVSSSRRNGNISEREEIRRKFQNDPDCKILISTTVMDEGVDLTAATDLVHLTLPYTPAAFDQRNRRSQRIGEIDKDYVNVHVVKPKLDGLTHIITDGMQNLLDDKRRIIDFLLHDPFSITEKDLEEIKNGDSHKSKHLSKFIQSPIKELDWTFGKLRGKGHIAVKKSFEEYPEGTKNLAEIYASHWEGYYGGNTANLYTKIIREIEKSRDLENVLDVASGPFSLSRKLERPVVNLDLNQHMLNTGRILEEQEIIVPGNIAVQGLFHDLPFEDKSFDLALCSLALHYSKTAIGSGKNKLHEREKTLREMNRILKPEGYGIITLPHSVINESDFESFNESLNHLGFNVLPLSGFYNGADSKFKVYVAGLQKIQLPNDELLKPEQMQWEMDKKYKTNNKGNIVTSSKKSRKHKSPKIKKTKPEIITEFVHSRKKKSIEEMVKIEGGSIK